MRLCECLDISVSEVLKTSLYLRNVCSLYEEEKKFFYKEEFFYEKSFYEEEKKYLALISLQREWSYQIKS